MPRSDTTRSALAIQMQVQQAMSGEERFLLAVEMSLFARELAREHVRSEHPDWPEAEVARELLRLVFLPKPLPARLR